MAKDSAVVLPDQPFTTAHIKDAINLVQEFEGLHTYGRFSL
jgi:hypothetical protein